MPLTMNLTDTFTRRQEDFSVEVSWSTSPGADGPISPKRQL